LIIHQRSIPTAWGQRHRRR